MARKARNLNTSTLVSITQKSKGFLFRDDQDRENMLMILKQTQETFAFDCFAYCLLDDQLFKLIIDTKGRNISTIMSSLLMSYSAYRKSEEKLFSGRFRSVPLNSKEELQKEIELIHQRTKSHFNSFCFYSQEAQPFDQLKITFDLNQVGGGEIESTLTFDQAKERLESWMRQKGCDPLTLKKNKDLRNQCIHEFRKTSNCSLKTMGLLFSISESSVSKILSNK